MKSKNKGDFFWPKTVELYQQAYLVLIKDPTIWIPFVLLGILDLLALLILFLAPSPPVSHLVAPIIRTFWSDRFLHYPVNFILLPKLQAHAHFLITTIFGVFVTGIAVKKIEAGLKTDVSCSILDAIKFVLRRFIPLICAWLLAYFLFKVLFKILNPILTLNLWVQLGAGYAVAVLAQAALGFIIPAVVLADKGFFKSFVKGLAFGFRNIVVASILIIIPIFMVTVVSFAKGLSPIFIARGVPEAVILVLVGGIILTVVADIWVTSVTTVLFLRKAGILSHENA